LRALITDTTRSPLASPPVSDEARWAREVATYLVVRDDQTPVPLLRKALLAHFQAVERGEATFSPETMPLLSRRLADIAVDEAKSSAGTANAQLRLARFGTFMLLSHNALRCAPEAAAILTQLGSALSSCQAPHAHPRSVAQRLMLANVHVSNVLTKHAPSTVSGRAQLWTRCTDLVHEAGITAETAPLLANMYFLAARFPDLHESLRAMHHGLRSALRRYFISSEGSATGFLPLAAALLTAHMTCGHVAIDVDAAAWSYLVRTRVATQADATATPPRPAPALDGELDFFFTSTLLELHKQGQYAIERSALLPCLEAGVRLFAERARTRTRPLEDSFGRNAMDVLIAFGTEHEAAISSATHRTLIAAFAPHLTSAVINANRLRRIIDYVFALRARPDLHNETVHAVAAGRVTADGRSALPTLVIELLDTLRTIPSQIAPRLLHTPFRIAVDLLMQDHFGGAFGRDETLLATQQALTLHLPTLSAADREACGTATRHVLEQTYTNPQDRLRLLMQTQRLIEHNLVTALPRGRQSAWLRAALPLLGDPALTPADQALTATAISRLYGTTTP
jgi:hypothetical protein